MNLFFIYIYLLPVRCFNFEENLATFFDLTNKRKYFVDYIFWFKFFNFLLELLEINILVSDNFDALLGAMNSVLFLEHLISFFQTFLDSNNFNIPLQSLAMFCSQKLNRFFLLCLPQEATLLIRPFCLNS